MNATIICMLHKFCVCVSASSSLACAFRSPCNTRSARYCRRIYCTYPFIISQPCRIARSQNAQRRAHALACWFCLRAPSCMCVYVYSRPKRVSSFVKTSAPARRRVMFCHTSTGSRQTAHACKVHSIMVLQHFYGEGAHAHSTYA